MWMHKIYIKKKGKKEIVEKMEMIPGLYAPHAWFGRILYGLSV